jgi:hypothetical protein
MNDLIERLNRAVNMGERTGSVGKHPTNIYVLAKEAITALQSVTMVDDVKTKTQNIADLLVPSYRTGDLSERTVEHYNIAYEAAKIAFSVPVSGRLGDYRLGLERAADECRYMARGYAAHLMRPLLDAAERIREIPDDPKDEPHCQRRDGQTPAVLPRDKHNETAIDRLTDHAENGTMPPQFREDLRNLLALVTLPVSLPTEPTHAITRAMAESIARDDEGEMASMGDLLGFSGENKTHTVLAQAWRDGVAAVGDR